MAEDENTPPQGEGKDELRIEARRVTAETIVILESVAACLEAVQKLPEAILLRNQLETIRELVIKAVETVEGFAVTLGDRPAS